MGIKKSLNLRANHTGVSNKNCYKIETKSNFSLTLGRGPKLYSSQNNQAEPSISMSVGAVHLSSIGLLTAQGISNGPAGMADKTEPETSIVVQTICTKFLKLTLTYG